MLPAGRIQSEVAVDAESVKPVVWILFERFDATTNRLRLKLVHKPGYLLFTQEQSRGNTFAIRQ